MQLLMGQIPGVDETVKEAARHGYEAMLLAVIVLGSMALFGWLVKAMMNRHLDTEKEILAEAKAREERLASRVTTLEDTIRIELLSVIKENSQMMGQVLNATEAITQAADRMVDTLTRFMSIMESRPCLLSNTQLKAITDKLSEVPNYSKENVDER